MQIHEVMNKTGLSKKAINYYESKHLLEVEKGESGYREYSQEQVELLMKIKLLRKLDFSITEIEQILANNQSEEIFEHHFEALDRKMAECQIQKDYLSEIKEYLRNQEHSAVYEDLDQRLEADFGMNEKLKVKKETKKKEPVSVSIVIELCVGAVMLFSETSMLKFIGVCIYCHAIYVMRKREAPLISPLHYVLYAAKDELSDKWRNFLKRKHSL